MIRREEGVVIVVPVVLHALTLRRVVNARLPPPPLPPPSPYMYADDFPDLRLAIGSSGIAGNLQHPPTHTYSSYYVPVYCNGNNNDKKIHGWAVDMMNL